MLSRLSRQFAALGFAVGATCALALSPSPRLLRMVPPDAPLVAGFRAPERGLARYFMLITESNRLDLNDFMALTGADPTRRVQEAVFVSGSVDQRQWREHSLLVQGSFDLPAVLRFADGVKVRRQSYRGVPVLVVRPFERERHFLKEIRWLALLDTHIAVFGTTEAVKQEVNRDLDDSLIDPGLSNRLARLSKKDGTWSILTNTELMGVFTQAMYMIDKKLGSLAEGCESMQIGIELGTRARLEYEVTSPVESSADSSPAPALGLSILDSPRAIQPTDRAANPTSRGVLKLSQDRYDRWMEDISQLRSPAPLSKAASDSE